MSPGSVVHSGKRRYEGILLAFTFAVLAIVGSIYIAFDLSLYADGSFFAFALATGDPWWTFWVNIPTRASSFVLTIGPPYLVAEATGNFRWALWTYSLALALCPVIGLLVTKAVDPWRGLLTSCCAFSTVSVVPFVVFFPTEIWVTHAMFWPTLGYAVSGKGRSYAFILPILLVVFALTHEAALVLLPMLAFISAAHRSSNKQTYVIALGCAAAVVAWVLLKAGVPIAHEATRLAVQNNGLYLFSPENLLNRLSSAITISFLLFLILERMRSNKRSSGYVMNICLGVCLSILILILLPVETARDETRYSSRLIVFVFLVSFSLFVSILSLRRYEALGRSLKVETLTRAASGLFDKIREHEPTIWKGILGLALISGTAHLIEAVRFSQRWAVLQDRIEDAGKVRSQPVAGRPDGGSAGPIRLSLPPQAAGPEWNLAWDWALPFHSLALSELRGGRYLIHSDTAHAQYVPIYCTQMAALAAKPGALHPHRLSLLKEYVCGKEEQARALNAAQAPGPSPPRRPASQVPRKTGP